MTSLNNRRLVAATCVSARTTVTRLTLSRQNSLHAQSTIVGARLALDRVSALAVASRSPGSGPGSVAGKPLDASVAAASVKTESEASSARHDDVNDDSDDVCPRVVVKQR